MKILKLVRNVILVIIIVSLLINFVVVIKTRKKIISPDKINKKYDCILVLGAGIKNNYPSHMLEDRLLTAIELFQEGYSDKIVLSGDHQDDSYDEVTVMKNYLLSKDIPEGNIILDDYGISTYDSIYRLKHNLNINSTIIVTQNYHEYRSLYIADKLSLDSVGISANRRSYYNQTKRDIREYFAIVKDYFKAIIKPQSKYH